MQPRRSEPSESKKTGWWRYLVVRVIGSFLDGGGEVVLGLRGLKNFSRGDFLG